MDQDRVMNNPDPDQKIMDMEPDVTKLKKIVLKSSRHFYTFILILMQKQTDFFCTIKKISDL